MFAKTSGNTFGNTCLLMMYMSPAPMALALSMNALSFTVRTCDLTILAVEGQLVMPMTTMTQMNSCRRS